MQSANDVVTELVRRQMSDINWRSGRSFLHMHHGGSELERVSNAASQLYFGANASARTSLPSLLELERDVIDSASGYLGAQPGTVHGVVTSGGTESIFLAVKAARDRALRRSSRNAVQRIVIPVTAHPAFDKAADCLGLGVLRVPVGSDYRVDLERLVAELTAETILVGLSAPNLPFGLIDPIEEVATVTRSRSIWLHVDACLGGLFLPFLSHVARLPAFEFSVAGVDSLSVDPHKYGYAAKGISLLLLRRTLALPRFQSDSWPLGRYETEGLLGTRAASPLASAWAIFRFLGREGLERAATDVWRTLGALTAGVRDLGCDVLLEPDGPILCITAPQPTETRAHMLRAGWYLGLIRSPPAMHLTVNLAHCDAVEPFVTELGEALKRRNG